MKRQNKRRPVTDEEFRLAQQNSNNNKIIKAVLNKYTNIIPEDELHAIGLESLWRCLGYHRDGQGNKFTTSLWWFVTNECRRKLKKINREKLNKTINISAIETKDVLQIPAAENKNKDDIIYVTECMNKLSKDKRDLIYNYYIEQYTMEEIGKKYGYSKEAARQKINKAVQELRKLCVISV